MRHLYATVNVAHKNMPYMRHIHSDINIAWWRWSNTGRTTPNGGRSTMLDELCDYANYVPVIITHFFNKPIQNSEFLRKLYLEKDLSSYEIHRKTGWSRTSISDALRELEIKKETRKSPSLCFGEKFVGNKRVPHKGEQKVISKMIDLREQGHSFKKISEYLNDKNIPTKLGGSWYPSTVKDIVKRELKKRED